MVIENLESHGMLVFHFSDLESREYYVFVMERHQKCSSFCKTYSAVYFFCE